MTFSIHTCYFNIKKLTAVDLSCLLWGFPYGHQNQSIEEMTSGVLPSGVTCGQVHMWIVSHMDSVFKLLNGPAEPELAFHHREPKP